MSSSLSISNKIHLALGSIFLIVLVVVVSVAVKAERELSNQMIEEKLREKASSYLDAVNMLMVSGAISNRELVRTKILSDPNIIDARILRHEAVDKLYGKGFDHEYPADELDRRALKGEDILINSKDKSGHVMTYLMPILAYKDYRGTNCIPCHQVEENDVLGAIRISYSLDQLDQSIFKNMLTMGSIQAAMFVLALLVLTIMLKRLVISPIRKVQQTLSHIEKHSDLTQIIAVDTQDEIGSAAQALNKMTERFSDSLKQVVNSAKQLESSAREINDTSKESFNAARAQKNETQEIQEAIQELHQSIQQVMSHAQESNDASAEAHKVAKSGVQKTDLASQSIETMNSAIQSTSLVIASLDERSNSVGSVLSVIKGIAEQTNLLALNAAIEAARAGESGRGFAVVADEVRTLSQRTAESTQEIERMIAQLQAEAQNAVNSMDNAQQTASQGMERVREAADALYTMTSHVERMNQLSQETLSLMQEQVGVGDEVSHKVSAIREHSEQSADTANNTLKVAESLVTMAQQLSQLVNRFKL